MQKKSGYLNVKGMTRKDRVRIIGGKDFIVKPHIHEGCTFMGHGTGFSQVYLPEAKAGRKFTFITSPHEANGVYHQIELNPLGGIYATDTIYDPNAAAFLLPGYSIHSSASTINQRITIECHNDGAWSVIDTVGTWQQPNRSFELVLTTNDVEDSNFIGGSGGGTGVPTISAHIIVKNDKYIVAAFPTNVSLGRDLDGMTIEDTDVEFPNAGSAINWPVVTFPIGDTGEIIGRDMTGTGGLDLLLSTGDADILVADAGMTSGVAVTATQLRALISGLEVDTIETESGTKVHTFIIDVLNDEYREDITAEKITFDGGISDLVIDTITLSEDDTKITIVTESGTSTAEDYHIILDSSCFVGSIANAGIDQRIDGSLS